MKSMFANWVLSWDVKRQRGSERDQAGALYWVEATFKDGSTHRASWARKE